MSLHEDEFLVDDELVAGLIAAQMPEWSSLSLRRLDTAGTVNVTYRLGDDKLVRLPRLAAYQHGPLKESRWLAQFAPTVPLQIPDYLALGEPSDEYPSAWSVLGWIEGENATQSVLSNLNRAAKQLGEFVVALRSVSTDGAPNDSNRGRGLSMVDEETRSFLSEFPDDLNRDAALNVWESCLAAPDWQGPPTWFHGDLHSGNLLSRDGELFAVIDFEGCSAGDPASDLIAAWWLFDQTSRNIFLSTIGSDEASLTRGMGWALHMSIAAIPYYQHTNPSFASLAHNALSQILAN
jgi:aminoglycoside phosphotransferase (APT) family kinase protein